MTPARPAATQCVRTAWRRRVRLLLLALVAVVATTSLAACTSDGDDDTVVTRAEVATLLAQHGAAVRDRDRAAFLDGLAAGAYRDRQRTVYANLAKLPLTRWTYTLGPAVDASTALKNARKERGASAVIVRVTLRYALRDVDPVPTSHDQWLTVVRRDGKPVIAADTDLADEGGRSWQGPWDFGAIDVLRTATTIVIAHPADAGLMRPIAEQADRAVPAVTAVVGRGWTRHVAVVVPASTAERDAVLGSSAGVSTPVAGSSEIVALATEDGQDTLTGRPYGQRVVVDADQFRRLTPLATRIVLRHEVTHLAVAAETSDATPRWLAEGFAEYVGNLGTGRPVRSEALELGTVVRRSGVPELLPGDTAFASAATAASAYQQAWLACRLIAAQDGQSALLRFYRAVSASPETSDRAVVSALRSVLGESAAQFVARWRSYVAAQFR